MSLERIKVAGGESPSLDLSRYSIFGGSDARNRISVWQPSGKVDGITSFPQPQEMRQKASSFLQVSVDGEVDLAVAPEWAYNLQWIQQDRKQLFARDSPLFVLGCAPVKASDIEDELSQLRSTCNLEVYGEDPTGLWRGEAPSREAFVTPTVIPIRETARKGSDCDAIYIQYKNQPMGEGANPTEYDNLCCGEQVWQLRPRLGDSLIAITCSEVMDYQLANEVRKIAVEGNYVVHVQCNPKPFNHSWTRFRSGLFDGKSHAAYIAANWSDVGIDYDGDRPPWGYSGLYTNTPNPSSVAKYNETHRNGGVAGTKPEYHTEYVWSLAEDSVSIMEVKRDKPDVAASGKVKYANPYISSVWTWDQKKGKYGNRGHNIPTHSGCKNWQQKLPDSPLAQELISSISVGDVSPTKFSRGGLPMAALKSFRGDEHEQLGQIMPAHQHRTVRGAEQAEVGLMLDMLFTYMQDKYDVKPLQSIKPTKMPINAVETSGIADGHLSDDHSKKIAEDVEDDGDWEPVVPVSLSILEYSSESRETKRAGWIYDWIQARGKNVDFFPLVVTTSISEKTEVKTLNNISDTAKALQDPREVDGVNALAGVDE